MTSKLTRERIEWLNYAATGLAANGTEMAMSPQDVIALTEYCLAGMDSETNRNPVLAYADSYRDMAKQGVESVQIWSVITDLERNIAPLYRHAQQPVVLDESYQQLSDLYHAQEKRLFKIAQRIKGPAFDKYSHSPSQAIDVLEAAIFGENEACSAAMLQSQPCDDGEPTDDERIMAIEGIIPPISSGNSPVIPDGYVMVPKEMTDEIGEAIAMQANCCGGIALDIYDAMLAAAPQELK